MNLPFTWCIHKIVPHDSIEIDKLILFQVLTEEGEEESEMTCSERLQAELQEDPGGGPPLIPLDPPDTPGSPREDLTGDKGTELLVWLCKKEAGTMDPICEASDSRLSFSVYL